MKLHHSITTCPCPDSHISAWSPCLGNHHHVPCYPMHFIKIFSSNLSLELIDSCFFTQNSFPFGNAFLLLLPSIYSFERLIVLRCDGLTPSLFIIVIFLILMTTHNQFFSSVPPCVATAPIVATNFLSTIFPYANLDTIRKLSLIALATFIDAGPKLLHMVPPNRNAVNSIVSPSFVLSSSNVLRDEIIDFSSCPPPPPSHSTFDLYHSWASSCNSFLHTSSHFCFTNFLSLSSSVFSL